METEKTYDMDMSQEREQDSFFEDGWYLWEVFACREAVSKQNNEQFIITLAEDKTMGRLTVFAISVPGKRWLLKQFLRGCDVEAAQDGKYKWKISEVIGKIVAGRVRNKKDDDWIDRNNVKHEGEWRSRIVEFRSKDKMPQVVDIGQEPEEV